MERIGIKNIATSSVSSTEHSAVSSAVAQERIQREGLQEPSVVVAVTSRGSMRGDASSSASLAEKIAEEMRSAASLTNAHGGIDPLRVRDLLSDD